MNEEARKLRSFIPTDSIYVQILSAKLNDRLQLVFRMRAYK